MQIKNALKKSQAPHRHDARIPIPGCANSDSVQHNFEDANNDINYNLKKEDFTKFLMKRRHFLQKKALCGKKNYSPELELLENEVLEAGTVISDLMDIDKEEKDYVDENEDI